MLSNVLLFPDVPPPPRARLLFPGHQYEVGSGRLFAGSREIRITPKASAVLTTLVTRPGDIISKAEIFDRVWPGIAVGDDALTSCVQELRRALNDDARRPSFIETRHRRGYCFIAPLLPA